MAKSRERSVRSILLRLMVTINLLIVVIMVSVLVSSDFLRIMRKSELQTLEQTLRHHGSQMEERMLEAAAVSHSLADGILLDAAAFYGKNADMSGRIAKGGEEVGRMLNLCQPRVVDALKANAATGIFVVLDASVGGEEGGGIQGGRMAALYLNDEDISALHQDNSDLILYYGSKSVSRSLSIPLDNQWDVELAASDFSDARFLTEPYAAAKANPGLKSEDLGYWSGPVARQDGKEVFYHVVPLLDSWGNPFGLVGAEVSADYLKNRLRLTDYSNSDDSFYLFAGNGNDITASSWLFYKGAYIQRNAPDGPDTIRVRANGDYGMDAYALTFPTGEKAVAIAYPLSLHGQDSPYGAVDGALLLGSDTNAIFYNTNTTLLFFIVAAAAALLIGIWASVVASEWFVRPIKRLSGRLADMDPDEEIDLGKTGMGEIDVLIDSIEQLSVDLLETGRRTLETIEMIEMPIGYFEINPAKGRVYLSEKLFLLFGVAKTGGSTLPLEEWGQLYGRLEADGEGDDTLFRLPPDRWLRLRMATYRARTSGIIMDVTAEIKEKRQLEFERDTDPLTGLLNRQAFHKRSARKVRQNPGHLGVMLFGDLDNLKYVNDNYGHDSGDRYIKAAADALGEFAGHGGVVARISGDEFAVFLYGPKSREELTETVSEVYRHMLGASITLPDGTAMRLRCSMGFAWYPGDSADLEALLRYADFAMNETKRTVKNTLREFDLGAYMASSYQMERNEDFNQLIENNMVDYMFQPVVDVYTGGVFAYEALMRPRSEELQTPGQVLQAAKDQAKLYHVEHMTIFNIYRWVAHNFGRLGGRKLFYNMISDRLLSEKDLAELEREYGQYFGSTAVEIEEAGDPKSPLYAKIDTIRAWDAADLDGDLDGTKGSALWKPRYVRVGRDVLEGLAASGEQQDRLREIVASARRSGSKVIAGGVETEEEMEQAIRLGADYIQGFYIGRPSFRLEEVGVEMAREIREVTLRYRDRRRGERAGEGK